MDREAPGGTLDAAALSLLFMELRSAHTKASICPACTLLNKQTETKSNHLMTLPVE